MLYRTDPLYLLLADPNVGEAFQAVFIRTAGPAPSALLEVAHEKARSRRFTGEPVTGLGALDDWGSERCQDIRARHQADDLSDQLREERGQDA